MNVGKIEEVKRVFLYMSNLMQGHACKHKYVHVPVQALAGGEVDVCCGVFTCLYVGVYYVLILYFRNCLQKKKKKHIKDRKRIWIALSCCKTCLRCGSSS